MKFSKARAARRERRRLKRKAKARGLREPGQVTQRVTPTGEPHPKKLSPRGRRLRIAASVTAALRAPSMVLALKALTGWFSWATREEQAA